MGLASGYAIAQGTVYICNSCAKWEFTVSVIADEEPLTCSIQRVTLDPGECAGVPLETCKDVSTYSVINIASLGIIRCTVNAGEVSYVNFTADEGGGGSCHYCEVTQ